MSQKKAFSDLQIIWKRGNLEIHDSNEPTTSFDQKKILRIHLIKNMEILRTKANEIRQKVLNSVKIAQWLVGENLRTDVEASNSTFQFKFEPKIVEIPEIFDWIANCSDQKIFNFLENSLKFDDRDGHLIVFIDQGTPRRVSPRFVTIKNMALICGDGLYSVPSKLSDLKKFQCGSKFENSPESRKASHYVLAMLHEILHIFLIPHSNTGLMNKNDVCDSISNYLCNKENCLCVTHLNRLDHLSIELVRRSSFITGESSTLKVCSLDKSTEKLMIECLSGESIDYLLEIRNSDSSIRNFRKCSGGKVEASLGGKHRLLVATAVCLQNISTGNQ